MEVKLKRYNIIYADPPWNPHGINKKQYVTTRDSPNNPSFDHLNHYPCMTFDEIAKLNVNRIADDNCILFIWVTDVSLPYVFDIINVWGFSFVTVGFTWIKKTATGKDFFGMGQWTRKNPEMCLIAKKGTLKRRSASVRQLQYSPVEKHSKKPDVFRKLIVELCGDLPRLELFCRHPADGWDVWGNEVESTAGITKALTGQAG